MRTQRLAVSAATAHMQSVSSHESSHSVSLSKGYDGNSTLSARTRSNRVCRAQHSLDVPGFLSHTFPCLLAWHSALGPRESVLHHLSFKIAICTPVANISAHRFWLLCTSWCAFETGSSLIRDAMPGRAGPPHYLRMAMEPGSRTCCLRMLRGSAMTAGKELRDCDKISPSRITYQFISALHCTCRCDVSHRLFDSACQHSYLRSKLLPGSRLMPSAPSIKRSERHIFLSRSPNSLQTANCTRNCISAHGALRHRLVLIRSLRFFQLH